MRADRVTPPADRWPAGACALTTTRHPPGSAIGRSWNLADHVGDDPVAVAANRRTLLQETGLQRIQWLNQVHGTGCIAADAGTVNAVPEADAAWTAEPGLGLAILTADCVPAVIVDRAATVVGVAHGGWRGLVAGVLEGLVRSMPSGSGELVAWLGPAIGPTAYEVGDDVAAAVAGLPDGAVLVRRCLRPGRAPAKHWLDLFALSEQLLLRAGVAEVLSARLCTATDGRFFSYRRDGQTGRMATLAWLTGVPG